MLIDKEQYKTAADAKGDEREATGMGNTDVSMLASHTKGEPIARGEKKKRSKSTTGDCVSEDSRLVRNLTDLMERYNVSPKEVLSELNERRLSFETWIAHRKDERANALPRLRAVKLAKLFKERGNANELEVLQALMPGKAAGALVWLFHFAANPALSPSDDDKVAKAMGFTNKWPVTNAYRSYKEDTQTPEFTRKLAEYLNKNHAVDQAIVFKSLLSIVPSYDTVASETIRRVPVLTGKEWLDLRIDWTTRGDDRVSEVDKLIPELLADPDIKSENFDSSETNPTSLTYIVEDNLNQPEISAGARVQIDLARTDLEPNRYYLLILAERHGMSRQAVLRRFQPLASGGGIFATVSGNDLPIVLSEGDYIAGRAWKVTCDI